jgi:hypothetical protein
MPLEKGNLREGAVSRMIREPEYLPAREQCLATEERGRRNEPWTEKGGPRACKGPGFLFPVPRASYRGAAQAAFESVPPPRGVTPEKAHKPFSVFILRFGGRKM